MIKLRYEGEGEIFYATVGSVGFDIRANDSAYILPGNWQIIPTGLFIDSVDIGKYDGQMLPELQIRCRSGLASKFGIVVLGGVSTVDPDYKGEIMVPILNMGSKAYSITKGDRIAQGVCGIVVQLDCLDVLDIERGEKGFGSTGI